MILGNRYESQLCAIEMEQPVSLCVCMEAKVSQTIRKLAEERGCSIIVTPYDTFTAARMINQSMPIEYFMKRNHLTTFHLSDKTEDIKEVMGKLRHRDFPDPGCQRSLRGNDFQKKPNQSSQKQLILVDHNESSQTVDGIENAHILEIIDHHRIGTLETLEVGSVPQSAAGL